MLKPLFIGVNGKNIVISDPAYDFCGKKVYINKKFLLIKMLRTAVITVDTEANKIEKKKTLDILRLSSSLHKKYSIGDRNKKSNKTDEAFPANNSSPLIEEFSKYIIS